MRKMFLFAAAAMVSLSSCVQTNEVYTGKLNEMGFKSAVTRGIIQSNEDMIYPIAVTAILDNSEESTGNYVSYFENAKFVYDDATSLWKGEPARYWPTSGDMNFVALCPYPVTATIQTAYTANGMFDKLTFGTIDNNIKDQHDVLYSDILNVKAPQKAAQSLFFHHAYSQLNVTFQKTASAAKVVIKSVAVNDVNLSGILNVTPVEATLDSENNRIGGSTATWTVGLPIQRYFLDADATGIEDNALDVELAADSAFAPIPALVIPGLQTEIEIVYTIDGFEHTFIHDLSKDARGEAITPVPDWKMGHKYTYNYTINVNEIIFDCEVDEWKPVDGGSTTI